MYKRQAYPLSIAAVALLSVPGYEQAAEEVVDRLVDLAISEGTGIHWQPYPVETTGYAALALLGSGRPQAAAAIDWLTTQRNSLGGYGGSTQDTVVAIRALFFAARTVRRDLELTLELLAGNTVLETLVVTEANFDLLHSFELPLEDAPLRLRASGDGSVGFQVARKYHVPDDLLPPPRDMTIEVAYDSEGIEVDEILDAADARCRVRETVLSSAARFPTASSCHESPHVRPHRAPSTASNRTRQFDPILVDAVRPSVVAR